MNLPCTNSRSQDVWNYDSAVATLGKPTPGKSKAPIKPGNNALATRVKDEGTAHYLAVCWRRGAAGRQHGVAFGRGKDGPEDGPKTASPRGRTYHATDLYAQLERRPDDSTKRHAGRHFCTTFGAMKRGAQRVSGISADSSLLPLSYL